MESDKKFSTRDLYLATTLITLKFHMIGIDYTLEGSKNHPVGYFNFDETPELLDMKDRFMQGLLLVEPKTFITNLKSLKSEIVNIQQNPHLNR